MSAPRPRRCETPSCCEGPIEPRLDPLAIDQASGKLPGYIFECGADNEPGRRCGWKRIEPVRDAATTYVLGWTASNTPARRAGDVVPV